VEAGSEGSARGVLLMAARVDWKEDSLGVACGGGETCVGSFDGGNDSGSLLGGRTVRCSSTSSSSSSFLERAEAD